MIIRRYGLTEEIEAFTICPCTIYDLVYGLRFAAEDTMDGAFGVCGNRAAKVLLFFDMHKFNRCFLQNDADLSKITDISLKHDQKLAYVRKKQYLCTLFE